MNKSLLKKGLIAFLIICLLIFTAVGCGDDEEENPDNNDITVDKTALDAELAQEISAQGDYTLDSYNAYKDVLEDAKALSTSESATQSEIDSMTSALTSARLSLEVRPVDAIISANKEINLISLGSREIVISDYVNTNGLSKISYKILTSNEIITASAVADGKFTITAGEVNKETDVKVTINVYYDNIAKRTVELSVKITKEEIPTLINKEVINELDLATLLNKESATLDFSKNVSYRGDLELTYSAKLGDEDITLDGTLYTFVLGTYTEVATYETFTVTITYTRNGKENTLEYTYKLALRDTAGYSLENGGFENGLDGWTVVGNIGNVSTDTHYWLNDPESAEGYEFGMDGEKMFSAYTNGAEESAVGILTSPSFTLGGSGFVTFKLGAMRDANYVYVDVVDADTKEILARYYNGLWADRTNGKKSGCSLIAYKADLSAFIGREIFFRISDNADSGYGLFFVDSFITYYETEPDGFYPATPVNYDIPDTIYDLFNGGFEMGDVQGWWNVGEPGAVTGADAFFSGVSYGKDGDYLYSGVEDFEAGNGREGNRGTLTSSAFELGGTGYISYLLGGGGNSLCYIEVIDATTGELLAKYRQQAMEDAVLKQYVVDLSAYIGRVIRLRLVDGAVSSWGCMSFDNVITYYPDINGLPEGITAIDIKDEVNYEMVNGSFENGIEGWTMNITVPDEHNTLGWVTDTEIDVEWYTKNDETKDGANLFTFVLPGDINCEKSMGTLESSGFTLKEGAFVSFKFGGAGGVQNHDVYIELCRADGSVIARFYNDAEGKVNTKMNAYYYQYEGEEVECFFKVVDNSNSDYGCFVVDDFRVNLDTAPEGYLVAIQ